MSDNPNDSKTYIPVGEVNTDLYKNDNDRLYNIGGSRGLNLTKIPGMRNGISLKVAGIYFAIYLIWSIPLKFMGLSFDSFGKVGYIIYFGPPLALIIFVAKQIKDSTLTWGQQMNFFVNHKLREAENYSGNVATTDRGITKVTVSYITTPTRKEGSAHGNR